MAVGDTTACFTHTVRRAKSQNDKSPHKAGFRGEKSGVAAAAFSGSSTYYN
jgi:hypothetical protein